MIRSSLNKERKLNASRAKTAVVFRLMLDTVAPLDA